MLNKDNIVNGYKVLSEKLDEIYLNLTIRQLGELQDKLEETWLIVERRREERRR